MSAGREAPPFALHPLYESDNVIAADALIGEWVDVIGSISPGAVVRITRTGSHRLTITAPTNDGIVTGWGYATAIDGVTFLDWSAPLHSPDRPWFPVLSVHQFARYSVVGDTLFLAYVPADEWAARLADRPELVVRQRLGRDPESPSLTGSGAVLLTPSTEPLRALVREMLRTDDVEWTTVTLVRRGTPR